MWLFIARTIKFALQGFFRNIWLSIVTIVILVLTLLSVTTAAGINVLADQAIASVQDKVDVSVYFKPDVQGKDVLNVQNRLESMGQVKDVVYTSAEQALENFKTKHVDDPIILDSISQLDKNPLGATLVVKAQSINDYSSIMSVLDSNEYSSLIQDKNYDDNQKVIARLNSLSDRVQRIGYILSAVFVIIAILIIFNTIRINIYTHREEIGIMKLVGASNWFVKAPFLVESLLYGLLAVVVSLAILYPLLSVIGPQVNNFFEGYNFDFSQYFSTQFWQIVGWQVLFATALSVISSLIAIGRYLRV
ncbi:MAG: permease-like cell division protein FtsX [Patescibacteria group bacterium]